MGGSLLCGRRVKTPELLSLAAELCPKLVGILGCEVRMIPSYRDKPDHGDLDLLVDLRTLPCDALTTALLPGSYWADSKGHAYSFLFRGVQVDLLTTELGHFESAYAYFSYNDVGNLIGKVARSAGFKFGHRGLCYMVYPEGQPTRLLGQINVTADYGAALEFLGYPAYPQGGFDTLEQMFRFVACSPLFSKLAYAQENTRHRDRTRDAKRKTYRAFLEFLETFEGGAPGLPDPRLHIERALRAFPDFARKLDELHALDRRSQAVAARFNGERVARLTGLEGPALSHRMNEIRKALGEEFERFVLNAADEQLDALIARAGEVSLSD